MGAEIVKALSAPLESAVHDCTQLSSESDCSSICCTCHSKTVGADQDDIEIREDTKENG